MKKTPKKFIMLLLALACACLCGCGLVQHRQIISEPPVFSSGVTAPTELAEEISVAGMSYDQITALESHTWLKKVITEGSCEYDAFMYLKEALPECEIGWNYSFDGTQYSDGVTELTVHTTDGLAEALHCLPEVRKVDMTSFSPDTDVLDSLIAAYPDVEFLFYVHFGEWTVRSDITCFSTLRPSFSYEAARYTSADLYPLFKYCKHLKALDCGHNYLDDLSELGTLTELQVLILADNRNITDISPLGNLVNLEYIELFLNNNTFDMSIFRNMTKMRDLNLSYLYAFRDISFIDSMPELEMFWCKGNPVSAASIKEYTAKYPNVNFHFSCDLTSSTCHGWRTGEDNLAVRKAFRNWWSVNEFRSIDDVEYDPYDELYIPEPENY